jgi:phospholipid-binding lipoprotein MlaA
MILRAFAFLAVFGLLSACATSPSDTNDTAEPVAATDSPAATDDNDPLEGFNRAIFTFNDKADRWVLKPVAKGYQKVVPDFARQSVSNFFSNLHDPAVMLNNLCQGKVQNAISDLGRFLINSTFGIYGLFDVASVAGLEKHNEDFGQTLATWGVGEGSYLVLPILGPSNLRDGVGLIPDWYAYPPTHMEEQSTASKLTLVEVINRRAQLLEASDILDQAAGDDPYIFVREAYRQQRENLVYDGNPPQTAPDPSLFEDDTLPPAPSGTGGGSK